MRLSVAGETQNEVNPLLTPDWYKELSPPQLLGYIRHSYIWRSTGVTNLTSPDQSRKNVRWDGGEDSFGCKFTPVWPRILKMIHSYDAEPGLWVAAHFSPMARVMRGDGNGSFEIGEVSPTNLCGKTSAKIYFDYCDYFPKAIAESCEVAMRSVVLRIKSLSKLPLSRQAQYACAICDESHVTAPPFFRHAIAANAEATDAAAKYLWPAAFEYESQQRMYNDVPPWCRTNDLMNAVLTIRTHWRRA